MGLSTVEDKDIRRAVRKAIGNLGGIKLPRHGAKVLIKPNVNTGALPPASTNPLVVSETIKLALGAGASEVIVGDRSWVQFFIPRQKNTVQNMKSNGIYDAARAEGASVTGFEEGGWLRVKPEGATHWRGSLRITKFIDEVDYIVSIPVLKTHWITDFSLSLKNSVGVLHTLDRLRLHASHIHEKTTEINLAFKVDLNIIDGSYAFIKGGPSQGEVVTPNLVIVSDSRVESDIAGYKALISAGANLPPEPEKHPMIARALELGLDNFKGHS